MEQTNNTETQSKRTLVVPDIHHRIHNVATVLAKEAYDEVVFLGDWLDSYFEPPLVASFVDTCEYLKSLVLEHPRRGDFKFLVGNHDMNYIFNNVGSSQRGHSQKLDYYCSGYTKNRCKTFRKTFWDVGLRDAFFLENFALCHRTQGWLLSHAGLIPEKLPYGKSIDVVVNDILPDVWRNFRHTGYANSYLATDAGVYRGGTAPVGGLLWLDWYVEMYPDPAVGNQIVGHTRIKTPEQIRSTEAVKTSCWNLDTELHYGIIENGQVLTHSYSNLYLL